MKKILIIFLLMSVSTIRAQQVSVGEAMSRAKAFLKANARHNAPARDDAATTAFSLAYTSQSTTDTGKVCYYIFNCNADFHSQCPELAEYNLASGPMQVAPGNCILWL